MNQKIKQRPRGRSGGYANDAGWVPVCLAAYQHLRTLVGPDDTFLGSLTAVLAAWLDTSSYPINAAPLRHRLDAAGVVKGGRALDPATGRHRHDGAWSWWVNPTPPSKEDVIRGSVLTRRRRTPKPKPAAAEAAAAAAAAGVGDGLLGGEHPPAVVRQPSGAEQLRRAKARIDRLSGLLAAAQEREEQAHRRTAEADHDLGVLKAENASLLSDLDAAQQRAAALAGRDDEATDGLRRALAQSELAAAERRYQNLVDDLAGELNGANLLVAELLAPDPRRGVVVRAAVAWGSGRQPRDPVPLPPAERLLATATAGLPDQKQQEGGGGP